MSSAVASSSTSTFASADSGSASASSAASSSSSSGSMSSSGFSSASSAGSTSGAPMIPRSAVDALDEHATATETVNDEYCMYNSTASEKTGCKSPRSCRACLQVTGCMINSAAQCVSNAAHYNESLDFRAAMLFENESLSLQSSIDFWNTSGLYSDDVQNWIFPSTSVKYCAEDDTACALCQLLISPDTMPDMRFCVGESRCVCTALCDKLELDQPMNESSVCGPSKAPDKPVPQAMMWVIGAAMSIVICSVLYWWIWKRTADEKVEDESDESYLDVVYSKNRGSDKPTAELATQSTSYGPNLDTPVMELSTFDSSWTSADSSRRRPAQPLVAGTREDVE